ncbi:MAG: ethylbenzene dehydrogenase-related protein [Acidimicrobiia bacterium]|nr:ethylbenzene dehydrogenase-related protein [Acidimicrobiia bacterium]
MSDTTSAEIARRPPSRRPLAALAGVLIAAAALQTLGANPATSAVTTLVAHRVGEGPELDPEAGVWDRVSAVEVPLTAQQTSYPMGGGAVKTVDVQALHDADALYVRLSWNDAVRDDATGRAEDFSDAAAIELPGTAGASVPAICMGQADGAVNIWQWRADSQEGLPSSSSDLGNGVADIEPPAGDDLEYPARNAGNPYALLGAGAVQNLTAVGFGTIEPLADQAVEGLGEWADGRWSVVYKRALEAPGNDQPTFAGLDKTDIAFAVWDGARDERNGIKSVSQFLTLQLSDKGVPGKSLTALWIAVATVLVVGAGVLIMGSARRRRKVA